MKRLSKMRIMKKSNIKTFECSVPEILCKLKQFGDVGASEKVIEFLFFVMYFWIL
jgi:hypothetical protein